jgi:hypothetical protein
MKISVSSAKEQMASSFEYYIFRAMKDELVTAPDEIAGLCTAYRSLMNTSESETEIVLDGKDPAILAEMIDRYMIAYAKEMFEDDMDWLCETMQLRERCLEGNKKGRKNVVRAKKNTRDDIPLAMSEPSIDPEDEPEPDYEYGY